MERKEGMFRMKMMGKRVNFGAVSIFIIRIIFNRGVLYHLILILLLIK